MGRVLRAGDRIRCNRPLVAFYPEGHPRRSTHHGPLLSRGTLLEYVGPHTDRPGVHVARSPGPDGWEVFFDLAHLMPAD